MRLGCGQKPGEGSRGGQPRGHLARPEGHSRLDSWPRKLFTSVSSSLGSWLGLPIMQDGVSRLARAVSGAQICHLQRQNCNNVSRAEGLGVLMGPPYLGTKQHSKPFPPRPSSTPGPKPEEP